MRRWVVLVLSVTAVACDGEGASSPDASSPDAQPADAIGDPDIPYDEPSEFSREGCTPGAFADRSAIAGIYHIDPSPGTYVRGLYAVRIDGLPGGGWGGLLRGSADTEVIVSDDDIILRHTGDQHLGAVDLCGVAADGTLIAHSADCIGLGCIEVEANAYRIAPLDEPMAGGMTLLGELGWAAPITAPHQYAVYDPAYQLRVRDGIAYVVRSDDGLRIIDVSDPATPVERAHVEPSDVNTEGGPNWWTDVEYAVAPDGKRYVFLAAIELGVYIYDVTNPAAPVPAGTVFPGNIYAATNLQLDGTRLYFVHGTSIEIWDVADPGAPVRLGGIPSESFTDALPSGARLYTESYDAKDVYDVSNPEAPAVLGALALGGTGVRAELAIEGRTIAVLGSEGDQGGARIVDVTDLSAPVGEVLASWTTRPGIALGGMTSVGTRLVVTMHQDGVRVVDLADPATPVEVAHHQTLIQSDTGYNAYEGAHRVDVDPATGRVYVLDRQRGLLVFRID